MNDCTATMTSNFPGYVCPISKVNLTSCASGFSDGNGRIYPVVNGVPRFVESAGYTDNFSFQWNQFAGTQIDAGRVRLSASRLWAETGWSMDGLNGLTVLEVGSGAGRFTRELLSASNVHLASVDYSDAVLANLANNQKYVDEGRLALAQASIYELPFADDSFDRVLCLGVLQHTPDFRESLKCLLAKLKPGGELVVDFYPINGWWTRIHAKYMFRPILKRLSHDRLLSVLRKAMPLLIRAYRILKACKLGVLTRFLPICDIDGTLPEGLNREQLLQWCALDTFDMYSPTYDNPQRITTVTDWITELGGEVRFADFVFFNNNGKAAVVRATKRRAADA